MTRFSIMVDLGEALPPGSSLTKDAFPHLAAAVQRIAQGAMARWQGFARGEQMPDGRSIGIRSGTYLRSIQLAQINDFTAEVYSTLPYASAIEDGMPARDMKRMLGSSFKVRVNAKGKRYLIIPFRHDMPGSVQGNPMPQAVRDWWRTVSRSDSSHITGHGWRDSGTGAVAFRDMSAGRFREQHGQVVQVRSRTYHWGQKLNAGTLRGMGMDDAATRRLSGMYRFDNPSKPGRHSQFITFRVMSEDSPGWQAPAVPGFHPARITADELRPVAEEAFQQAMARDIRAMLTPG